MEKGVTYFKSSGCVYAIPNSAYTCFRLESSVDCQAALTRLTMPSPRRSLGETLIEVTRMDDAELVMDELVGGDAQRMGVLKNKDWAEVGLCVLPGAWHIGLKETDVLHR
jgi:hypothetical protein